MRRKPDILSRPWIEGFRPLRMITHLNMEIASCDNGVLFPWWIFGGSISTSLSGQDLDNRWTVSRWSCHFILKHLIGQLASLSPTAGHYLNRNQKDDRPIMCRLVLVGLAENRSRSSRVSLKRCRENGTTVYNRDKVLLVEKYIGSLLKAMILSSSYLLAITGL